MRLVFNVVDESSEYMARNYKVVRSKNSMIHVPMRNVCEITHVSNDIAEHVTIGKHRAIRPDDSFIKWFNHSTGRLLTTTSDRIALYQNAIVLFFVFAGVIMGFEMAEYRARDYPVVASTVSLAFGLALKDEFSNILNGIKNLVGRHYLPRDIIADGGRYYMLLEPGVSSYKSRDVTEWISQLKQLINGAADKQGISNNHLHPHPQQQPIIDITCVVALHEEEYIPNSVLFNNRLRKVYYYEPHGNDAVNKITKAANRPHVMIV